MSDPIPSDIDIRINQRAGHITLNRPAALNALTYDMVRAIDAALTAWRDDPAVELIVIDATGDKAFCAGGDIADLYTRGKSGDFAYGQQFWRDEYRMNAALASYPKPVISFLQGFTMGGGVGVGCHVTHRIVTDSSRISMPECGIGLVPDVGGSLLLARAPGRLGAYLGLSGARMGPGDAIYAGFADHFVPQDQWADLKAALMSDGDLGALESAAQPAPDSPLQALQDEIDSAFSADTLSDVLQNLKTAETEFTKATLKTLARNAPLSMGCTIEMIQRLRGSTDITHALELEYRFTYRASEHADFLEGIRAAIIDKDRAPNWRHTLDGLPQDAITFMLQPLGTDTLTFEQETTT